MAAAGDGEGVGIVMSDAQVRRFGEIGGDGVMLVFVGVARRWWGNALLLLDAWM